MHVIMTAASSYVQDEQKRFNYMPKLTGQLSNAVQGFVDVTGFYRMTRGAEGKLHRRLYVQRVDRFAAKCRFTA